MIRLAIVEDEDLYVEQLKEYLKRYQKEYGTEFQLVRYTDGEDIVEDYKGDFDMILMDIQMHFMDGMEAAERIRLLDQQVIIMFITNMLQYAVRGYQVDALDYMVKPIEYFSFSQKLTKAIDRLGRNDRHFIFVPIEDGMKKLVIEDIYYVESQRHDMIYYTRDGRYSSRGTIRELDEKLTSYGFFRSGKSYLVNMKHVDGMKENFCMVGGELLPVSRMKRKEFMDLLVQYVSEVAG